MKRVPLLGTDMYALVDDADYQRVSEQRWYLIDDVRSYTCYASNGVHQLHVFLMGKRDGFTVDHANGIGLDCRRSNLRWATRSQQQANVGIRSNNTSGYKGVSLSTNGKRWRAFLKVNGHKRHLGTFMTAEEAARAYDAAALDEFGVYARLNFPA